jgi:hypothetical protein
MANTSEVLTTVPPPASQTTMVSPVLPGEKGQYVNEDDDVFSEIAKVNLREW